MNNTIICVNSDLGLSKDGTNLGPTAIYNNFSEYKNIIINKDNKYKKEKDSTNMRKNLNEVNKVNTQLFNAVTEVLNNNEFPITLGGDHSIAIGSALASNNYYKSIGIIWIDAHTDYNNLNTTITGNIHGLPLAVINGTNKEELSSFLTNNYISPKNTVVVGARSIDPLELEYLKEKGITVFTTKDIKKEGINKILDKAFVIACNNTTGVHISYDLDYIDPITCPGVSVPEKDGISEDTAYDTMKYLKEHKNIIKSLDLVEYNPLLDIDNRTLNIATNLLNIFLKEK